MNRTIVLSAATAIVLGGLVSYSATRPADAEGAPATQVADTGPDGGEQGHDGWNHHGWGMAQDGHGGWGMQHAGWRHHRHAMMAQQGGGLFYPVADKNLSVGDVQTLAQAMLLRHGNHTWKVADVAANQDNTVSFAFTTADGGVVARFAIETQTGRLRRIG